MTITELAESLGFALDISHPGDPIGCLDASPYAQACSNRRIWALSLTPDCAYSIVHELVHAATGEWHDEIKVRACQALLAQMLDEPWRTRAMPT